MFDCLCYRYGLGGQQFEFTGEEGTIYSLITDFDESGEPILLLNTLFGGAYTSGVFTDPDTLEVKPFTPKGTWIVGAAVQVWCWKECACNKRDVVGMRATRRKKR